MKSRYYLTVAIAALCITPAGVIIAQETDTTSASKDEIIVTATRREQSILEVPYNISAVTGADIENAAIQDSAELLRSIPGVALVDRGPRNSAALNGIRIRGLNVDSGSLGDYAVASVATVSTYVNDTPLFANLLLEDLQQVEVLRGPQATLYGSGTLGGTVRYLVNSPSLGEFSAKAGITASSTAGSESIGYKVSGTVNIPIGDTFALRATLAKHDFPGIIDYRAVYVLDANDVPVAPSGPLGAEQVYRTVEDADTVDIGYVRIGAYWEPSDRFNMEFNYFHQDDDIGSRRQSSTGSDGSGNAYGRYENGSPQLEPSSGDLDLYALEAEVDLGFATLSSSTSFYDQEGVATSDNTGFYANAGFLGGIYLMPRPLDTAVREFSDKAIVQEFRLVSNGDGAIDYVLGAYYMDQTRDRKQDSFYRGYTEYFAAILPAFAFDVDNDQDFFYRYTDDFTDQAVFGELTWHVSEKLHLNGGLRYFSNKSEVHSLLDLPLFTSFSSLTESNETRKNSDVLFRVNASYDFGDDDLVYATISEGYRRGGDSAVPSSAAAPFSESSFFSKFESDSVVNYEVGLKGIAGGVRYDLAAFYMDWSDPQLNTTTPTWGYFAVINGDKARTVGMEVQLSGNFTDEFAWALGYAYVDAEVTKDLFTETFGGTPFLIANAGDTLPGVPSHILNGALDYRRALSEKWDFTGHFDGYYQSKTRNALTLDPAYDPEIKGFPIFDANIGASTDQYGITLFVKNITNEKGITGVQTSAVNGPQPSVNFYGNSSRQYLAQPRTYGISLNVRY